MTSVDSASLLTDGPWQHRFVTANGARFHVALDEGAGREAPLVVLLHDVLGYWWTWRALLPELAAAGYRVAAMDLRGTGASDKPPRGYDVPTMARDVAGVIRSLGSRRAALVGAGTGGEIAFALQALSPEVVAAVAALATPHPSDATDLRHALRASAARRVAQMVLPSVPERSLTRGDLLAHLLVEWGGAPLWPPREVLETYRRAVRVPFAAHSQLEHVRWLVRSRPRPDGARYRTALERARPVPVLHLGGIRDGLRPAAHMPLTRDTAARVATTYQFELLNGVGHFLPDEAPDEMSSLLGDWLARVYPALP